MRFAIAARLGLASMAFTTLGLPDGLLGVAWPAMRADFGLPLDALGPLLVTFTSGYAAASFCGGRLLASMGLGRLLFLSCGAAGLGSLGYALAGAFGLVVVSGLVAGAGAGGIDAGLNTYAATRHGPRALNWLHACYGIGATGGPVILTAAAAANGSWRSGYSIVGFAQLGLAVTFLATLQLWSAGRSPDAGLPAPSAKPVALRETLALARWSIALFVLYTGLELAVGTFAFTLLTEARGASVPAAGAAVASYWAALTGGRVFGALLATRVSPAVLVRACLLTLTLGLGALAANWSPTVDLVALLVAGLAAGPVFPTLIATTAARVSGAHAANAVGIQIAAAAIGQSMVPSLLGVLGRRAGLEALALGLVVSGVLVLLVHGAARANGNGRAGRAGRRSSAPTCRRLPSSPRRAFRALWRPPRALGRSSWPPLDC
jgi:fucose permease